MFEEIKKIKETKKDLKKFGYTVGSVLLIISILLKFIGKISFAYFGGFGFLLIAFALISPGILKPFNKIWMTIALILSWIMTRVILIILFYLALSPVSLLAKLFKKDFLYTGNKNDESSYWIKRDNKKLSASEYERQF